MIRPIFCAGLALAWWCGAAEAQTIGPATYCSEIKGTFVSNGTLCTPDDAAKVQIDELKARVELLEQLYREAITLCRGDPPEHIPCVEKGDGL
jgi:hypothetical protein